MPDMDQLYTALRNADAAGDADAARKLAAHIKTLQAQPAPASRAPTGERNLASLITGKPAPLSVADKLLKGVRDPIDGGAQLLTHLLPDSVVQGGNRLNNWLANKTGLVARLPEGGIDQMTREAEQAYQARRAAGGESGLDGARLVGNMVSPANLAIASRLPAAVSLAGRVGLGAAGGAATSALAPTAGDDFWSDKGKQVAVGALAGGVLPAVGAAAARVISPAASKNASLALLRKEGVDPTIGQALGGFASKVEERLQSVPLVGDAIRSARGRANSQFQAAAFNRALAPVGEELPQGVAGREAVEYTEGLLRQRYDDVLNRIGAIPADQTFGAKLSSLGQMVNRAMLSPDAKAKFSTVLNDVQSGFQNGALTSDAYKTLESALGADIRKLTSSQDMYDGRLAPAVKQLQQELRELLQRQAGQSADELQAANAGWANFKRAQRAAGAVGAEDGRFTPAQFQNAVKAMDKSKDKGAFARGGALGQDLGDAGKAVLTSTVPNSGTADRLMNAGVIGSWLVNPAIPASLLASAGLYLPPAQRALVAAASSRPALAEPTADLVRQTFPFLVPGAAGLGLQVAK